MEDLLKTIKQLPFGVGIISLGVILLLIFLRFKTFRSHEDSLSSPIKKGSILESVYGVGTVKAKHSYALKVGVTATVQHIYGAEGDQVKRGQNLIKLDGMEMVKAPFEGTITYFPSQEGETVFAQGIILNLVNLQERYIVVSLEQRAAIRVRPGQKAKLSFGNMREQDYSGVVEALYSNNGQFLVRIKTDHLPPQILPDMVADVSITIAEHKNVRLIPTSALEVGKVLVYRKGEKPKTVEVQTGLVDGSMVEVLSGEIEEGDQVYLHKRVNP